MYSNVDLNPTLKIWRSVLVCFWHIEHWSKHRRLLKEHCLVCYVNPTLQNILFHVCIVMWDWTQRWILLTSMLLFWGVSIEDFWCQCWFVVQTQHTGHLSYVCIVMWDWTQHSRLEMSVLVVWYSIENSLKPELKNFDVSVGLSCKLSIGHHPFSCIVMNWHLMSLLFIQLFLVNRTLKHWKL